MRHREAIGYLPDLGSGRLEPGTTAEVRGHVDRCPACREWLATHDLLVGELSPNLQDDNHPVSELLALCIVRPEELNEPGREELRDHLVRCSACRGMLAQVQTAVRQARPPGDGVRPPVTVRSPRPLYRTSALAAGLVILVLAAGLLIGSLVSSRFDRASTGSVHQRAVAEATTSPATPDELSGQDLEGHQVIEADRALLVSKLTIKSGADVTFDGRDVIAFGDGFQVATGARLTVGSGSADVRPSERDDHGGAKE